MKANSLYSLIADEKYRNASLGRDTWKKLIGSEASLQVYCNTEGFNIMCGGSGNSKKSYQESAPLLTTRMTASLATPGLDLVQEDDMIPITPVEMRLLVNRIMEINTLKPWVTVWFIETKRKTRKVHSDVKITFRTTQ